MLQYLNLFLWAVFTVLACLVLYCLHDAMQGNPLSTGPAVLYLTTHRTVWGACICWVVFACATGNGGVGIHDSLYEVIVNLKLRSQYKKRLLLRCIHHFKSDLIKNMTYMRISGTEPSSVIPENYNFNQFKTRKILMFSKRYKSSQVDCRTWLHVPSGTPWST